MEENKALVPSGTFQIATMTEEAKKQMHGITLVFPQLKIPSGGQTFFDVDDEPIKELIGVIINHGPRNVYFSSEFDGSNLPPDCSSIDGITGNWRLDEDETEDGASYEARECASCPFNQFGSDKNGGKACKEKHQLYILTSDNLVPYSLLLPVSSVGPLNSYATKLFGKGKYLNQVLTSFTLEKATNKSGIVYSKVVLKYVRDLTAEELQASKQISIGVGLNG